MLLSLFRLENEPIGNGKALVKKSKSDFVTLNKSRPRLTARDVLVDGGWCKTSMLSFGLTVDPKTCKNITVPHEKSGFVPSYWKDVTPLLQKGKEQAGPTVLARVKNAYALHLQGFNTDKKRFLLKKNDVITQILTRACPVVTSIAGDEL